MAKMFGERTSRMGCSGQDYYRTFVPFPILNLNDAPRESIEQLGTKQKYWTTLPDLGRCLCKVPRPGSGEDWSEVVAAQIADKIGLPHARYILGDYHGDPLVVTPSFAQNPGSTLVLGNTLLMQIDQTYNVGAVRFHQSTHTIDRVIRLLGLDVIMPPRDSPQVEVVQTAAGVFLGYLALDALIGNTDRHHENWGLVIGPENEQAVIRLAPTFDHASSLGCHETDANRERRLCSPDPNFDCAAYAGRARSAFYLEPTDSRPLTTNAAFAEAAKRHPEAARYWIDAILRISREEFDILLGEVPPHRLSNISRRFALEVLMSNHRKLSEVRL